MAKYEGRYENLEHIGVEHGLCEWLETLTLEWRHHYEGNYEDKHDEYYRLWRGIWAENDKTRQSERSRIIAPALQQAVESAVAEIETASFSQAFMFDIEDSSQDSTPTPAGPTAPNWTPDAYAGDGWWTPQGPPNPATKPADTGRKHCCTRSAPQRLRQSQLQSRYW